MNSEGNLERARRLLIQVYHQLLDAGLGSEPAVQDLLVIIGQGGYLDQVKLLLSRLPAQDKEDD